MALTIDHTIQAQALTVQQKPSVQVGTHRFFWSNIRAPLLQAPGTREREWSLRIYRHHPHNTIFRGASAGLIKRIQTTPWEIVAKDADRWQDILMNADFGDWDRLIAKAVGDFLHHDSGAWIELIAPGDPRFAPDGPIVGIAAMDTLRIYPTGNATYPAIYYDVFGKMHLMHHSRVVQLVDNAYSEEYLAGYGECALSRGIAPVYREILINRYIESFLDDKPRPGIRLWQNVDKEIVEAAYERMERDRKTDDGGEWGKVINVYSLDTSEEIDVKEYNNTKAPEGFDFDKYKNEIVREIATCIGIDVQDIWEMTGGGLGTGTQSEILAQKSRGKAFGNLLKRIERMINRALPERVEFRWQYKDPQEDQEEADKAQAWANTITLVSQYLKPDEIRQLAANQIPAMKDVLLDADGNLRRLSDDDPEPPDTTIEDTDGGLRTTLENFVNGDEAQRPTPLIEVLTAFTQRSFTGTGVDFSRYIRSFARVGQAQGFPAVMMRATFREELYTAGIQAYNDGMREGGASPDELDALGQADRQRKVGEWLALQNGYINGLVDNINAGVVTKDNIRSRSDMWVSKSLRAIFYTGLHDAAAEKMFAWKLGATEEHCKTCLQLNGQVHKLKDYLTAGLVPGAQVLECKGFNCDCSFEETMGKASGRLPGVQYGPFASLTDRLGAFLRRLAGG